MKTQHVESLDELVFKNKNKLYGAYLLRRKYYKYLVVSLLSGLFFIFSAISYPLIAAYRNPDHSSHFKNEVIYKPINPVPPETTPPPLKDDPALPKQAHLLKPVVVDQDIATDLVSQDELGSQTVTPAPPGDFSEIPPVVDNSKVVIEQPVAPPEPYISVQEMPQFPGGDAELYKYLRENIKYPQEAKEAGIQGRVFVYFVVEPDGSISSAYVRKGIGGGCDEEAVRLVSTMPRWSPGKQAGIAVRVQFTMTVKFVLQ